MGQMGVHICSSKRGTSFSLKWKHFLRSGLDVYYWHIALQFLQESKPFFLSSEDRNIEDLRY